MLSKVRKRIVFEYGVYDGTAEGRTLKGVIVSGRDGELELTDGQIVEREIVQLDDRECAIELGPGQIQTREEGSEIGPDARYVAACERQYARDYFRVDHP